MATKILAMLANKARFFSFEKISSFSKQDRYGSCTVTYSRNVGKATPVNIACDDHRKHSCSRLIKSRLNYGTTISVKNLNISVVNIPRNGVFDSVSIKINNLKAAWRHSVHIGHWRRERFITIVPGDIKR